MESAHVKAQNTFHVRNNNTCSTYCKYGTAATVYTLRNTVCFRCIIVTAITGMTMMIIIIIIIGNHDIKELQKTAILGTAHTHRDAIM